MNWRPWAKPSCDDHVRQVGLLETRGVEATLIPRRHVELHGIARLALYSREGFTDEIRTRAAARGLILRAVEDLYR